MTKTQAFKAGLDGQPEPARVIKHISYRDPISWLMVEGDVETDASMQLRASWAKGRKQRELQEWAASRRATETIMSLETRRSATRSGV